MKTIKIILNDDGSVLSLSCGFQLNQYSYNDTLLNVYVPSNILENQTDLENVDYSNNVVMGMYYTLANGSQKVGNPYYFTFVKDNVVIDNKLYTLYERKMPKEFTLYYGTQTYCINVVALKTTIVNNVATNEVVGNITSNNFELNIVRATNMVDDGIEEDTDLSTLTANVNSLLANMLLKQDKSDVLIQVSIANGSNVKTSVVREALNVLNQRVAENFTNVTTNTGDITQLKQDVIDINNQLLTSFRYCGSYTSPNPPTNPLLNQLMSSWGLTARNGDVVIWTWTITGGTDKSYTCRYNVNNTWDAIEIPTIETASNTDAGLIQGNYDKNLTPSETTPNILASIVGGKIVDIYYKRGGIYHNLQVDFNGVYAVLNGLLSGTETAIKSQYATYDNSEYGSINPTPINQKYMTKNEGATKQFVTDYALPKTFNDVYRFDFTNNKLVSNSVNTSKTLATQLGSVDFGSYTIEKTSVLTFELSNKNTFSCNFYAMFDNNITDVTFTMIIKADTTPIASTTSETTDFTGGTYKKVSINGDFALLGDSEITIDENVTLSVELSANITTSATNNLTIYSNTTLPSAFTLNVASSTIIINGSGVLGGVNYHTLNGVKTNNVVEFALPSNTTLVDATLHTFILDYSGITIGTNTMLYITNGNVRHNINLPTNYNSGATLSYGNVSQFLAPNSKIVFTAIYENGFFTIIGGNTLSSTQIQALLNAKQNVIDSSHKLNADLVDDSSSSNKFVSAYLKSLITTNRQDINLLDGRVTNLENNPTSNVSGTNDGTNWTSITIGNETYAIPSGSSSGGSGSGETLVSITLTNLDVRTMASDAELLYDMHIFCTKTRWDSFVALASSAMQIDVTYDNVGTFFTNASQQEQIIFIGYLLMDNFDKKVLPQSYVCKQQTVGGVTLTDYQTFASADSFIQDGVEFLYDLKFTGISQNVEISNLDRGNVEYATSNTTVTATEFTSSVGGSSASSGAYYEIKTSDIAFYDENGNQITNGVLDNLRITLSEGQFEALKEKVNPLLAQMSMPTLTDINSMLTILNGAFTETSASASNTACNLFMLSNGYCDFSTSASLNGASINIPLEFVINVSMGFLALGGANGQGDVWGTEYGLITTVDGNDAPMGISATWTLSQYGTSGGSSSSDIYDLQAGDVTIVGAGIGATDYEVTLSQDLLDVIVGGKKGLFVSGTLMSAFTNGVITTPVLFNNINYNKVTAPNYDYIYGYQNITDLSTLKEMTIIFGYTTATQKWYLGLLNVDYNLEQMGYDISDLDTRVQTLENAGGSGGSELYEHNITLTVTGATFAILFKITNASSSPMTRTNVLTYLSNFSGNELGVTGYVTVSGTKYMLFSVYSASSTSIYAHYFNNGSAVTTLNLSGATGTIASDIVIQIQ